MRSFVRQTHSWIGAFLALFLALMAVSGTALVWRDDYNRWAVPEAAIPVSERSASDLALAADRARDRYGDRLLMVQFASTRLGVDQFRLIDGGAYADPTTGEVLEEWGKNERLPDLLFEFHHRLLSGKPGEMVIGAAGLLTAILIVAGIYLWWPFARLFKPRAIPRRLTRSALAIAHRDLGLIVAVPVLLLSLTGAAMIFHDTTKHLLLSLTQEAAPSPAAAHAMPGRIDWSRALRLVEARFPAAEVRSVSWPKTSGEPAVVRLRQPGELAPQGRSMIAFDPATGRVVSITDAVRQPSALRIYDSFYPLHAGKVGGLSYQIGLSLVGAGFFALCLYGFLAFLQRFKATRPR